MIALLPAEIAYNFKINAPDSQASRTVFLAWTLSAQFLFVLLAFGIVWGTIKLSRRFPQVESSTISRLLVIMGNMISLPQLILIFTMLDVLLYNAYGTHLMPLWLFAAIVMIAGIFILGGIFIQALRVRQNPPGNKEHK